MSITNLKENTKKQAALGILSALHYLKDQCTTSMTGPLITLALDLCLHMFSYDFDDSGDDVELPTQTGLEEIMRSLDYLSCRATALDLEEMDMILGATSQLCLALHYCTLRDRSMIVWGRPVNLAIILEKPANRNFEEN